MKKLNYKQMIKEVSDLVGTDFCESMSFKRLEIGSSACGAPIYPKYTQAEAREMSMLLGKIYTIAHCIHCEACQGKYFKK